MSHHVNILLDHARKNGNILPKFEYNEDGPPFSCTCTYLGQSVTAESGNLKATKREAAIAFVAMLMEKE